MFYIEKLKTVRKFITHETSRNFNHLTNIFVFDEFSGDIKGLNEKSYDSVAEESIKGKNVSAGYILMERPLFHFEVELTLILRDVLQFNLIPVKLNSQISQFSYKMYMEEYDFLSANYFLEIFPDIAPTTVNKHELYMRQPYAEFSSTFFIHLFDMNVWYALIGIILASCLFFGLYKLLINKFKFSLVETIYFTLGMADVRDSDHMGISLRVACFFISTFMFLIMAAFSTFLTTELTVTEIDLPFDNIDEIRHQTEYGYCAAIGSYLLRLEDRQGNSKFMNGGNCPHVYALNYTFIENICNIEKTVYLASPDFVYTEVIKNYNGHSPCDIYVFKDVFKPSYRFRQLKSKRNFKFKRQIARVITQLRTSGILQFLFENSIGTNRVQFQNNNEDDLIAVQYDHVKLIFGIYILLLIISVIILLVEVIQSTLSSK